MTTQPARGLSLTDDIRYLPGVGPKRAADLGRLGIRRVGDLLEHLPSRHERHESRVIEDLDEGIVATVTGRITTVRSSFGRRGPTISATLIDNTGKCRLAWFNAPWMQGCVRQGMIVRATGRVTEFRQSAQLTNPKIVAIDEDDSEISTGETRLEGVYPAIAAISSRAIGKLIATNLDHMLQQVSEWYTQTYMDQRSLPPRRWALRVIHGPTNQKEVERARRRLAYDELLLMQLAVGLVRFHRRRQASATPMSCPDEYDRRIRRRFPFTLTKAQDRAVEAIVSDLTRARPMSRLLQGDVGCGKTVVALYAALLAVANKLQVAIMAPTELLADQHARTIRQYLEGSRVRHDLLIGGLPARRRRDILDRIASGDLDIVVGTHALLQGDVHFDRLGLVIVDEQHRFGVRQRAGIRGKGPTPHYLLMTATPIPRTLAMTVFGDLDVTTIDQLPPGRSRIQTRIVNPAQQQLAWEFVRDRLDHGEQAFVVYPLIDESDKLELRAAATEYDRLAKSVFPNHRVGLLHGRMSTVQREAVMADFTARRVHLLVATTVVEVGIDVPNATCMVIEHAERYGLSQLHQLRGRIGRGQAQGHCLLMTGDDASSEHHRLGILTATTDGFRIAEEDLRLRGPGEMLGTRQHGLPQLRVADLLQDGDLLRMAQRDAGDLLREDSQLRREEHRLLRTMLMDKYKAGLAFIDAG